MIIKKVKAKVISNSRGEDTIKIQVKSDFGKGEASAPSGASKGKHEFFAPLISTEPPTPLLEPLMIYFCIKFYFDFARVIPVCP